LASFIGTWKILTLLGPADLDAPRICGELVPLEDLLHGMLGSASVVTGNVAVVGESARERETKTD